MDEDVFYLDLNKVTLLGWERQNLFSKVEKMVNAIENGDEEFPPVFVKRIDDTTYALTHHPDEKNRGADGGHHRAIAHYIASRPLKCRLVEESIPWKRYPIDNWGFELYPIPESILVDKLPKLSVYMFLD